MTEISHSSISHTHLTPPSTTQLSGGAGGGAGGSPLAPLVGGGGGGGRGSAPTDGSEPRAVAALQGLRVMAVAAGKNHMLAITDNGVGPVSCLGSLINSLCCLNLYFS